MKKFTRNFLILLSLAVLFTACTKKQELNNNDTQKSDSQAEDAQTETPLTAEAQVDFIDFEATISNDDPSKTNVQLSMNNHQEDLSAFDYVNISKLDGQSSEKWQEDSNGIGGHHLEGTLTFPKTKNPKVLTLTGLPVGEVILKFNQTK